MKPLSFFGCWGGGGGWVGLGEKELLLTPVFHGITTWILEAALVGEKMPRI